MNTEEKNALYIRNIQANGTANQIEMIVEECAELIMAVQKVKRAKVINREVMDNFYEEVADVEILIEQARMMFESKEIDKHKDYKLERLKKRLDDKAKTHGTKN